MEGGGDSKTFEHWEALGSIGQHWAALGMAGHVFRVAVSFHVARYIAVRKSWLLRPSLHNSPEPDMC